MQWKHWEAHGPTLIPRTLPYKQTVQNSGQQTNKYRRLGVVLQENMLFNRSIRDNIALADPGMPIEQVMQAAQLAGAHDFILALQQGYDTLVDGRLVNLEPGMAVTVEIKTGSRHIIQYLLSPLRRHTHDAFREK